MPPTSRTPFRQTNFSAFQKTLLSNSRSALLCPSQCTPSRTPFCEVFLHTAMPTIFANPANPVLTPWFILLFKYGGRESWGGGGGGAGEDLSLTRTSSPPDPPKSIHLNPFHYTATKSSFTPLEVTTGQDKIYGHTAHSALIRVDIHGAIHAHLCCIKIPVFSHNYFA